MDQIRIMKNDTPSIPLQHMADHLIRPYSPLIARHLDTKI